ncbi:MAG: nucleoside-triphosphatase [Oscillospiraceae bacterium]|nr:nucleoside-triphosphatase [Oscillospiraceae bacterium]
MNTFLTGEPGVGKSTIIEEAIRELRNYGKSVAGYYTTREITSERKTFWINDYVTGESVVMAVGDSNGNFEVNYDAFEIFAAEAISRPADVIVLDELGVFEEPCEKFKATVYELLGKPQTVLGVLKLRGGEFLDSIKAREDVRITEVTIENRDSLM